MSIRNGAKAIIVRDNKVLLNRCIDDKNEVYYKITNILKIQQSI